MLKTWRKMGERKRIAEALCAGLMSRAREPVFFRALGVSDSMDGRFDLLALHAWLVLGRLSGEDERDTAQALTNAIFVQFDEALRDQGVGDIGIGHRVKKMADAFYGRLKAYGDAEKEADLATAILRNIYRGDASRASSAKALAAYAMKARERLSRATVLDGVLEFGPLPVLTEYP